MKKSISLYIVRKKNIMKKKERKTLTIDEKMREKQEVCVLCIQFKIRELELCRWFRFAQLAKGKKFRP
jgi:hypothetical protein